MSDNALKTALIAGAGAVAAGLAYWGYNAYVASKAKSTASKAAEGDAKAAPVFRVVLTGGPCGGKSSALDAFTKLLKERGYDVFMVPEVPTILLGGGCKYPGVNGDKQQLLDFEKHLIDAQLALEDSFAGVARSTRRPAVVVHDRGTVDVAAYVPAPVWADILAHGRWTEQQLLDRYDLVLHLVTAADGAEQHYTTANNAVRSETAAQARELDQRMRAVWRAHKRHVAVDNSTDFKGKIARASDAVIALVDCDAKANASAKAHGTAK